MKLLKLYIETKKDNQTYFCSMFPAALLLSSPVVSLTSSFRTLFSILAAFLLLAISSKAQTDTTATLAVTGSDTTIPPRFFETNKNFYTLTHKQKNTRQWVAAGINVAGYGGVLSVLSAAWYSDYQRTGLHAFNDNREWLQMDKVGHFYGTWIESRANNEVWRWAGLERKKRIWVSGLTSFAFQTTIEYLDGRSAEWGWSWGDFAANVLGSGTFIAQELAWDEQRIKLKWSFHRKKYDQPMLNQRSDELFGKSTPERMLKDYNGQTYWASASLKSFFPKSNLPAWLSIAVGYGAEGMFGGEENIARDDNGNIIFDRRDIKRYRQWYLSPDIDFTKIKTNKKGLKFLFTVLSAFKFPAPSLEWSKGKLRVNAIHF